MVTVWSVWFWKSVSLITTYAAVMDMRMKELKIRRPVLESTSADYLRCGRLLSNKGEEIKTRVTEKK